jgi:hypothetical protein
MRRLQALLHLSALLAAEVSVVVLLHRLGGLPAFATPSGLPLLPGGPAAGDAAGTWALWLLAGPPEDVVAAVLRLVALAVAWWLLGSTVLCVLARAVRVPVLLVAADRVALPAVRRLADRVVAVALTSTMSLAGSPALANQVVPEPVSPPIAAAPERTGVDLLVPPGAGGPLVAPSGGGQVSPAVGDHAPAAPQAEPRAPAELPTDPAVPKPGPTDQAEEPADPAARPSQPPDPELSTDQGGPVPESTGATDAPADPPPPPGDVVLAPPGATQVLPEAGQAAAGPADTAPADAGAPSPAPGAFEEGPVAVVPVPPPLVAPPERSAQQPGRTDLPTAVDGWAAGNRPRGPAAAAAAQAGGAAPPAHRTHPVTPTADRDAAAPPGAVPGAASPPSAAEQRRIRAGEHLWAIAAATVAADRGVAVAQLAEAEIHRYWRELMAANATRLRSGDVDVVYPGEVLVLPPVSG